MKRCTLSLLAAVALHTPPTLAMRDLTETETLRAEIDEDIIDTSQDFPKVRTEPGARTRYPLVFLHGFMGWDEIFRFDYFYQVRSHLQQAGYEVFTPQVNPVNSIAIRAQELGPKIDAILHQTGAEKINIIAHSMGGLDARYLIQHGFGHRIASLTSIGTPHHGTPVAELVFRVFGRENNILYKAFEYLVAGFFRQGDQRPSDLNLRASLWNLSPQFIEEYFNPNHPNDPAIYYQSYAGVSSLSGWTTGDRLDPILAPFQVAFGLGQRNDGLIPEESAQWGRFRGYVSADHIDLIGQLFGTTSKRYQHLVFYRQIADELVDLGF